MSQYIGLVHNLVLNRMEKGELNIDSLEALKKVLQEYEIHTKIIEDQLDMCKKDHAELRSEMNRLVNENRDLYERLKMASESSLDRISLQPAIEAPPEVVDNLQQQLFLALEEKHALEALWKNSAQEVDELKEKLKEYQSGKQLVLTQSKLDNAQKDYTEAIKILENKVNSLKGENDQLNVKCQFLEDQVKETNSQMALANEKQLSLKNSLKDCTEREQEWKSKYLALEAKFIDLDRAYQNDKVKYAQIQEYEKAGESLKMKLEESLKTRDELQAALERCQERMQDQLRIASKDHEKVEEALVLVEGACRDRDEALAREAAAAEELRRLNIKLNELVDEAGRRVAEVEANLRNQYDDKLDAVKDRLRIVEQERDRKKIEVEQLQKECERLQDLATQGQKSSGDEADRLSKQLGAVESNCERLQQENEALKEALDQLDERCRRNSMQKQKLKDDIHKLVKDTQFYQQELAMSEQKADLLNSQLQATSLDLAKLQSNTILRGSTASGVEPQVSLTSTLELYRRLNESYGQMNDKWKSEMNALTDKFEEKLKKSKRHNKASSNKENAGSKKW